MVCCAELSLPASAIGLFWGLVAGFSMHLSSVLVTTRRIKDADTAENNSGSTNIIIYPVACAVANRKGDAPKLSGVVPEIRLRPGSYVQTFYGQETVTEEFFCNFEMNPEFEWAAMEAGFPVVARGASGEARCYRVTHAPVLYRDFVPAAACLQAEGPASLSFGICSSRQRLG